MIETKGRENATLNSKNAELGTLPLRSREAQEHCRVHEALLDHVWLFSGGLFSFCRSAAHRHWWKLHSAVVRMRWSTRSKRQRMTLGDLREKKRSW